MGVYYKNLYKPVDGETGWGGLIDINWDYLGDRNLYVVKTADETVTSSAVQQDDNELYFFMSANGVWHVTANLICDTNGVAGGALRFAVSVPSGATVMWGSPNAWTPSITGGITAPLFDSTAALLVNPSNAAANTVGVKYHYYVTNGSTTGNFQIRWTQSASNSNPSYVRANSMLEVKKVV